MSEIGILSKILAMHLLQIVLATSRDQPDKLTINWLAHERRLRSGASEGRT